MINKLDTFKKSVERLEEALALEKNEIVRDSVIKRFELCFDLCWKTIQEYAKSEAIECNSPRSCFKSAFQLKLIDYDELWLAMIEDRNTSVHVYREEYAEAVYANINKYLKLFKLVVSKLDKKDE